MHQNTSQLYSKKDIKTLLLRLNTYVLTSKFWISSQNSWKTAQLSKMLYNNVPLTAQRHECNALSPQFPWCSVFSNPIGSYPSLFRVFDFFLWFFIQQSRPSAEGLPLVQLKDGYILETDVCFYHRILLLNVSQNLSIFFRLSYVSSILKGDFAGIKSLETSKSRLKCNK